jgi:two-component system, OmpR family, phosphate regulon response regulator PhoB
VDPLLTVDMYAARASHDGHGPSEPSRQFLRHGPLEIDVVRLSARVDGCPVRLSAMQLRLLIHFARHPDRVYSRRQLLAAVWGPDSEHAPARVDVMVSRLRRQLGAAGALIETTRGFGYRFTAAPGPLAS